MARLPPSLPPSTRAGDGPLRVYLAADDPLVLRALERMLGDEGAGRLEVVDHDRAQVALWDAGRDLDPSHLPHQVPTLALVTDQSAASAALAGGARGAVLRTSDAGSLWAALVAVHHGLTVLDGAFAPEPQAAPPAPGAGGIDDLTGREREVLALLAHGLSNRQIAARLEISDHTAKFHASAILAKLGATTRTEAVVIAARRGLVSL